MVKFLLIVANNSIKSSIQIIQKLKRENDRILVVPLDLFAKRKLEYAKVKCISLNEYLNLGSNCKKLDEFAAHLARTWYKSINNDISYMGISLGEMVEYDFYYLFVDALRCIEIAKKILEKEDPDKIFVPSKIIMEYPNEICYEMLPNAFRIIAKSYEIPVESIPVSKNLYIRLRQKIFKALLNNIKMVSKIICKLKLLKNNNDKKKVLFMGYLTFPVYQIIKKELEKNGYIPYYLHIPDIIKKDIIKVFSRIYENFKKRIQLNYDNINLINVLDHRFHQYFISVFPQLVEYIDWATNVIKTQSPDILIVGEDVSPRLRTISKVFRLNDIPVLVLQHGVWGTVDLCGIHVMPVVGNKIAVWGDYYKNWLIQRGKPPEVVAVIGNPKFDLMKKENINKSKLFKKLNLNPQRKLIVYATQWFASNSVCQTIENYEKTVISVLEALKKAPRELPDVQVVIKIHPGNYKKYKYLISKILDDINANFIITKDYILELLGSCDVLITHSSTVGLEAMLFDKPIITVNLNCREEVPYASSGAAIGVYRKEDILPAIKLVLYDEKTLKKLADARKKFISEHISTYGKEVLKKLADLIIQIVESSKGVIK